MQGILILVIAAAIIICVPLGVIWALNQLFGTVIDYSFLNWCAVLILASVIRSEVRMKSDK